MSSTTRHVDAAAHGGRLPVDELLRGFRRDRESLIPMLQSTQARLGYLSEEAVAALSDYLRISENEIFGVASFYSQFRFVAPGRNPVKVCLGTACHVRGGQILCEAVQRALDIAPGQTTADGRYDLQRVACLGCCALAPVLQIRDDIHSRMSVTRLLAVLEKYE